MHYYPITILRWKSQRLSDEAQKISLSIEKEISPFNPKVKRQISKFKGITQLVKVLMGKVREQLCASEVVVVHSLKL